MFNKERNYVKKNFKSCEHFFQSRCIYIDLDFMMFVIISKMELQNKPIVFFFG